VVTSVSITYKPDQITDLTKWIWEHRDLIGGMAFLPSFDAQYAQLPYVEISKEEYERRIADFTTIDFSKLWRHEAVDLTSAAQQLALWPVAARSPSRHPICHDSRRH
jgi:ribonucleoside-diphosphate reductase alpha chain